MTPQASSPAQPEPVHLGQVPRVPGFATLLRGLNAGVSLAAVHDSSIGWYSVVTPAVSYAFSPHYSADASVSIYPYRLVEQQKSTPPFAEQLVANLGDTGDTLVGLHASFNPSNLPNRATAAFTLPSGDRSAGLGTGRATFDFSEYMEHHSGPAVFLLDLGAGDSSGLVNSLVAKDYNSLGPLAHFQLGAGIWLLNRNYIQSFAYEELPLGSQTVYSAIASPGSHGSQGASASTVVYSNSESEDNGFTTSLSIPLSDQFALSGYYNRSLRHHIDTVSFGMTYVMRGAQWKKRLSLVDRALREAEGANQ